jgi:molybdate transport system substrate-binding protein
MAKPFRGRSFSWSAALLAALAVLAMPVPAASAEPAPRKLAVAASANLRLALVEVAGAFERRNPGVKVEPTFGATGALQAQIQGGTPFDLFLGADRASADRLQAAGLARGEPFPYAIGKLVLWIANPARVDPGVLGLAAVSNPGVKKVAIANPEVAPYGVAAEEALRSGGILDTTRPKFVVGESVVQVVQLATSGSAQAAFVPWSFVLVPPLAAQGRYVTVPAGAYKPILQYGVVLAGARDPRLAEEFVAFLRGPSGRTILERHKYALPPN